jgi:hypothetical protein
MKNIQETLQLKEQEMKRLEKEISVLRAALSILNDTEAGEDFSSPVRTAAAAAPMSYQAPPVSRAPERVISEPVPASSPYPTFARNADMIEQIRPEGVGDRPKRSFP